LNNPPERRASHLQRGLFPHGKGTAREEDRSGCSLFQRDGKKIASEQRLFLQLLGRGGNLLASFGELLHRRCVEMRRLDECSAILNYGYLGSAGSKTRRYTFSGATTSTRNHTLNAPENQCLSPERSCLRRPGFAPRLCWPHSAGERLETPLFRHLPAALPGSQFPREIRHPPKFGKRCRRPAR